MASAQPTPEAVTERLDRVDDPELDESIVDLEYIDDLAIEGAAVSVVLVLPTAWCSPAFAWMMATGARDEVADLPGVETVEIRLEDHMHAAEINRGVNEELAFQNVFPDAEDGIETVRRTLDEKARMARQYDAVRTLRTAGVRPEQVVSLRREDLTIDAERAFVSLADGTFSVSVPAEPLAEYVEKAEAIDLVRDPTDRLFATSEGDAISLDAFERVQHHARLARTNVTGQGSVCAALHESRNGVAGRAD